MVIAATEVVPNWATILICTNPTVVNSRFEIMVGQANRHTFRLVEGVFSGRDTGKWSSRFIALQYYHLSTALGGLRQVLAIPVAKTVYGVVVYHTRGLHVGIHDRTSDKCEAASLHVLAQSV